MKRDGINLTILNSKVDDFFNTGGNSGPIDKVREAAIDREILIGKIEEHFGTSGNLADLARDFRRGQLKALDIDPTTLTLVVRV